MYHYLRAYTRNVCYFLPLVNESYKYEYIKQYSRCAKVNKEIYNALIYI